jgi:hypothetical protein
MERRGEQKYDANACFLSSKASTTTRIKNGNRHTMLKVIQHSVMIAIFLSGKPAGLEIAIKMASIGKGNDRVVKKRASFCVQSVCFLIFQELRKFRPPAKKKLEGNSGPDPLILGHYTTLYLVPNHERVRYRNGLLSQDNNH